jgi:anti-sigma factor RsiW
MMTKNMHCGHTPFPEAALTCRQVTALLVDYVAVDMDALTRVAFEAHLRHCSACTAFLATYRETIRATRAVRDEVIPELTLARVRRFLRRKIEGTSRHSYSEC